MGTSSAFFYHLRDFAEGLVFLGLVFGIIGTIQICKSNRLITTSHEILWVKPWGVCISMGLFGLFFLLAPILLVTTPHVANPLYIPVAILFGILPACLGLFLLRFAGTLNFRFDLDQGTYRCHERLGFYQRTVSGIIREDITGIHLTRTSDGDWTVRISWKNRDGSWKWRLMAPALARYSSKSRAEVRAEQLAAALGVPFMSSPWRRWWIELG